MLGVCFVVFVLIVLFSFPPYYVEYNDDCKSLTISYKGFFFLMKDNNSSLEQLNAACKLNENIILS